MTDMEIFEQRFAESLRTYASPAARSPRHDAVATAVASGREARAGKQGWLSGLALRRLSIAVAAGAAVLVLVFAGAFGFNFLINQQGIGGPVGSPSPTSEPTPSTLQSPRPGEATFTSAIHGISIGLPAGWQTRPATEPWAGGPLNFDSPAADVIFDPAFGDRLYMVLASQPYGGLSEDAWRGVQFDWLCGNEGAAVGFNEVWSAGFPSFSISCGSTASAHLILADTRGYLIRLVASRDEPGLADTYDWDWHKPVLRTVDVRPEEALPTVPSPTPEPTPDPTLGVWPDVGDQLAAGTYLAHETWVTSVPWRFIVPEGWTRAILGIQKNSETNALLSLRSYVVERVFADSCAGHDGGEPVVGPSADDLVAALLQQTSTSADGPFETSVGGYPAQRIDLTTGPEVFDCAVFGASWVWRTRSGSLVLRPNTVGSVYVVDVDGVRVVLTATRSNESSGADLAELDAMIESIAFGP